MTVMPLRVKAGVRHENKKPILAPFCNLKKKYAGLKFEIVHNESKLYYLYFYLNNPTFWMSNLFYWFVKWTSLGYKNECVTMILGVNMP